MAQTEPEHKSNIYFTDQRKYKLNKTMSTFITPTTNITLSINNSMDSDIIVSLTALTWKMMTSFKNASFPKIAFNCVSYLLEEWRVFSQVFGNHIETKKVAIDALSCHCQAVHVLVFLCCYFEQPEALFSLQINTNSTICTLKQSLTLFSE